VTKVAQLALIIGKGGVGKTTVAAGLALRTAYQHRKQPVLLMSTDPAHSLADIFQKSLGDEIQAFDLRDGVKLAVWQVNAKKQFQEFLSRNRKTLLEILEKGSILSMEDVDSLLDSSLPGMAEMSALLGLEQALSAGKYEHIVVDTAPFGHTLRLLELPEYFQRFLGFLELASSRDRVLAQHFGGRAETVGSEMLEQWRAMAERITRSLKNAEILLVTTPEKFALNESLRFRDLLQGHSSPLEITGLILNRAATARGSCRICQARAKATREARLLLRREFPGKKMHIAEDLGTPILGVPGLAAFGEHVFARRRMRWKSAPPASKEPQLKKTEWPTLTGPLSLVLGKGGVGKTTVSAALGFRTRERAEAAVEICSVDPAPSLDDVFQAGINNEPQAVLGDKKFRASEMDSVRLFKQWVHEVKSAIEEATTAERSGIHLDLWFERQLFSELLDMVPPGVDEVLAIIRISELLEDSSKRVIIDMAPTGHALDLLRTPDRILAWTRLLLKTLAAHRTLGFARDAGVKVAELGQRIRDLSNILQDPKRTRIYTVVLPEPLPDRETERLLQDLEELGLASESIFINRVLFAQEIRSCPRCQQAQRWQMATVGNLQRRYREKTLYVVRNFSTEIAGRRGLRSFTNELWRVE
jgi:arsenite/tail-anchored protein-transporting ATPase